MASAIVSTTTAEKNPAQKVKILSAVIPDLSCVARLELEVLRITIGTCRSSLAPTYRQSRQAFITPKRIAHRLRCDPWVSTGEGPCVHRQHLGSGQSTALGQEGRSSGGSLLASGAPALLGGARRARLLVAPPCIARARSQRAP